jgi:two-component system phosphate regulon sensor histidine kinase PhoR
MWPPVIFAACVLMVLIHVWWRERRFRRLRAQAQREYTEKLLAQHRQILAEAQARQQVLFDSMREGFLLLDSEGRIAMLNKSLARLLEIESNLAGASLESLKIPGLSSLHQRLIREGTVWDEIQLSQPRETVLEVNGSIVQDASQKRLGAIFVFHDLTRLKQLERVRQEFVANVSHELRTPISLIKGFAETLLHGAKEDPVVSVRFLRNIEKHSDRLMFLIEDLLTVSKLESGQVVLNVRPIKVREVAEEAIEHLRARAEERGIQVENQVDENLVARADPDRLEQILFNLIENAIKYGKECGNVQVGGQAAGPRLKVWVRDDGMGIPAESRDRVFERFYRVDRARSRETGGTGLGLAIVKHIVQAHGGEVWLESEEGRGATFFFTIPAEQQAQKSEPRDSVTQS